MTDKPLPALRETVVDRAQTSLRTLTSLIDVAAPGVGSVFGELITVVLPANREERMALFATELHQRLRAVEVELADIFRDLDAEQLALLEDGLRASARATQQRRIEQIADVVSEGVRETNEAARQRGVLDLLGSLSDHDVAYLARFANWRGLDDSSGTTTVGQYNSMPEAERLEFDRRKQSDELSRHRLIASGLLRALLSIAKDHREESTVVPGNPRLTEFGEYFCLQLGIWKSGERRLFPRV